MSPSERPFRVIVVGGSVAGITASHCLQKAGIDHIVLERRDDVAPQMGASISIYPHASRILHQIGCLDAVNAACVPYDRWHVRKPDGRKIMDNGFMRHLEINHGSALLLLARQRFLEILYDGLPDKKYIRTGCWVKDIKHTDDGVEVILSTGEVEFGDMVIGADGIHSSVRTMMWEHANKTVPGSITTKEKTIMKTEWRALFGIAPNVPELGARDLTVVSNKRYSLLTLCQPDRVYFSWIMRVDDPFTWPNRRFYTEADKEALARKFYDHPISDAMVFGELWQKRLSDGLVNLEEGVLNHWHAGRIVLAGDSAHKVTPNIALGGNSAMESIVVLCNKLHRTLKEHNGKQRPSAETLSRLFAEYEAERVPRMQQILALSSFVTKVQAWDTPLHKFVGDWVLPLEADGRLAGRASRIIRTGAKLDYVDDTGFPSGRMPWDQKEEEAEMRSSHASMSMLVRAFAAVLALVVALQGARLFTFANASSSP